MKLKHREFWLLLDEAGNPIIAYLSEQAALEDPLYAQTIPIGYTLIRVVAAPQERCVLAGAKA